MDDERRVRIIGYPLELTTLAEDDKRYERLSRKIEDAHERGDMTVVMGLGTRSLVFRLRHTVQLRWSAFPNIQPE